ncbi:uncharacterized protein LOC144445631 [Glandiceps talaboti]
MANNNGIDVSIADKEDIDTGVQAIGTQQNDVGYDISHVQECLAENSCSELGTEDHKINAVLKSVSKAVDLPVELISLTDNFFQAGGNSVSSIVVLQSLRRHGYELDIEEFYTAETLQDVVNLVRDKTFTSKFAVNGIDVKSEESSRRPHCLDEEYEIIPLNEATPQTIKAAREMCIDSILWSDGLNVAMKVEMKRKAVTSFVKTLFHQDVYRRFSFFVVNTKEDCIAGVVVNVDFSEDEMPTLGSFAPSRTPALEGMLNFKRQLILDAKEALRVDTPGKWLFQVMSPVNRDEAPQVKASLLKLMEAEKLSCAERHNFDGVIGLYNNAMCQWVAAESGLEVVIRSPTRSGLGCTGLDYFKYNNSDDLKLYIMAKVIADKDLVLHDSCTRIRMVIAEILDLSNKHVAMDTPLSALTGITEDNIVQVVRNIRRLGINVGVQELSQVSKLESIASCCTISRPPLFTLVTGMRVGTLQSTSDMDANFLDNNGYELIPYSEASTADRTEALKLSVEFLLQNEPMVGCLDLDVEVKRIFATAAIAEVMYNTTCQSLSFFLRDKNGHVVATMLCADLFYQCYPSYEGIACQPWQSYINTMVTMEIYYKCILGATAPGRWACQVLSAVRSSEDFVSKTEIMKFLSSESIRLARSQSFQHMFGLHTNLMCQELSAESGMEVVATSFPIRNIKFKGEKYFENISPKDAKIRVMARDFID